MITPTPLQIGDKIGIVAPAKRVSQPEMEMAISILKNWGLEVVLGKNLYKSFNQFAGTDQERTEDLQTMLDRPDLKAIMCARGGYGTIRIVDKLDFTQFLQYPKWVVGFSDITVLHCHLQNLGIESMHGIMPLLFPKQTEQTIESLHQSLFGNPMPIENPAHPLNRLGEASGELIGGNLSLFANTIGTVSEVNTQQKILFLEDVDEYVYHLDRMMIHLYRAGKLKNLAALVLGQFSKVKDNEVGFGKTVYEVIADLVSEYHYPVAYDFPIGHEIHNMTVICGRKGTLKNDAEKTVLSF
ncbi:MAG: LD-carboxypeptidase [Microscillaceae bacterium]|jgi:muramoyltetrapeptide carboxypeptidase|nr:LD-carboxypeptidase [Microscillaceae bacterium]